MSAPVPQAAPVSSRERFRDRGQVLYGFLLEGCEVRCPSCQAAARVAYAQAGPWTWVARLRCGQCAFSADSAPSRLYSAFVLDEASAWFGPVHATGRRACGRCGAKWVYARDRRVDGGRHRPATLQAACARCGHVQPVAVRWYPHHDAAAGTEPLLGLALVLREAVGPGREVWAFNHAHLQALKAYVGARLRERACNHNRSHFMRLPAWIKSAKQRDGVLAAIARIERRTSGKGD